MKVELLVIPDGPNTAAALDLLRRALSEVGMPGHSVRTTVVRDQVQAQEHGFPGSPTLLINGVDPFAEHPPPRPWPAAPTTRPPAAAAFRTPHSSGRPPPPQTMADNADARPAPVPGRADPLHRGVGVVVVDVVADGDHEAVANPKDLRLRRSAIVPAVPALGPLHRHQQHHRITADLRPQHLGLDTL